MQIRADLSYEISVSSLTLRRAHLFDEDLDVVCRLELDALVALFRSDSNKLPQTELVSSHLVQGLLELAP